MKGQVKAESSRTCFECSGDGPLLIPYADGYICDDCAERYRVGRDNTTRSLKAEQLANRLNTELVVMQHGGQQVSESLEYAAEASKQMVHAIHSPLAHVQFGAGGEVIDQSKLDMVNTLQKPTLAAIDASNHRTELITSIGGSVAAMALDVADTIQADNSIEKMLAHQMAAIHDAGMRTMQRANVTQDIALAARLLNSASRCFDTFQRAALAVERLRGKQEQRILVQHVNVGQGGQAVIGNIQTGVGDQG